MGLESSEVVAATVLAPARDVAGAWLVKTDETERSVAAWIGCVVSAVRRTLVGR